MLLLIAGGVQGAPGQAEVAREARMFLLALCRIDCHIRHQRLEHVP